MAEVQRSLNWSRKAILILASMWIWSRSPVMGWMLTWLGNEEVFNREVVAKIKEGASSAVDEFEKVQRVRKHTQGEVSESLRM